MRIFFPQYSRGRNALITKTAAITHLHGQPHERVDQGRDMLLAKRHAQAPAGAGGKRHLELESRICMMQNINKV